MDLDQTQTPSTTANDQSFGPALIGSSSLDSPSSSIDIKNVENLTQIEQGNTQKNVNEEKSPVMVATDMGSEAQQQPEISQVQNDIIVDNREFPISIESQSAAPTAPVAINNVELSGDTPLSHQQHNIEQQDNDGRADGDMPTVREAEQYADDLARELINDTNQSVNEEHSNLESVAEGTAQEAVESAIFVAASSIKQEPIQENKEVDQEEAEEVSEKTETDIVKRGFNDKVDLLVDISQSTTGEEEKQIVIDDLVESKDREVETEKSDAKQSKFVVGEAALYFDQDSLDMQRETELTYSLSDRVLDMQLGDEISSQRNHGDQGGVDNIESTETAPPAVITAITSNDSIEEAKEVMEEVTKELEEEISDDARGTMEFTKNYSDDLLMSSTGEQKQQHNQDQQSHGGGGHDLADFELPPYSGSSGSSGSEQAQASTSANTLGNVASSSSSSTDLTAIKNILISSYSKFSHVFHWRNPIESGIFLGIGMTLITALTFFSIISVVAYSALGIILASGLIRIYKASMKTMGKSSETPMDHIWDIALNLDVKISPETMHKMVDVSNGNLNASFVYFKQVLLIEDKLATLKFAFFLYMLTYIGAWFNGLTLITITYLSLFSIPLLYEKNKSKIDENLLLATNHLSSTVSIVTNKVTALVFGTQSSGTSKKHD